MEEIFYRFNPWWEQKFETKTLERKQYTEKLLKELNSKDIVFIVGLRRVGKTTLMHQIIERLLSSCKPQQIFYLSLDHPAFEKHTIMELLEEYRKLHNLSRSEKIFLFLDEIHLKQGFERELKVLYDMENMKIFASGSSSLAIRHKGAFLTGRYKKIFVEPLSFSEFLEFKNLNVKKSESYLMERYAEDYIKTGGIPEYVLRNDAEYLVELLDSIIYKDIAAAYGIRNPRLLKELLVLLAERVGKRLSYNKLANLLDISVDTAKQYVSYFEESFIISLVQKKGTPNERVYAPKKIYFSDTGMRNVLAGWRDIGSIAENAVFIKIKRMGEIFYFAADEREVDFVFGNNAIESKYKDELEDKEMDALKKLKFDKIVVTKKIDKKEGGIRFIPLWKFLLEDFKIQLK